MTNDQMAGDAACAIAISGTMGLRVAELVLSLDARGAGLGLTVPAGHVEFIQPESPEDSHQPKLGRSSELSSHLVLLVRNSPVPETRAGQTPLCRTEIWELWVDEVGRYVFVAPRALPPCQVKIDPGFATGEVASDFSSNNGNGLYPLQGLDNLIFTNWLAGFGDVILHSSGVVVDGKAFCFVGSAGAGKSTLAAYLAANHAAAVLGEDQLVLRYLGGRFWVYGTPWHLNPAMCSPHGAPLEKLFFLERMGKNQVAPCSSPDGVARLLQTAFIPYYRPAAVTAILDRLTLLAEGVPFHTLAYRLGDDPLALILGA